MSRKERERLKIFERVKRRELLLKEAAELCHLSSIDIGVGCTNDMTDAGEEVLTQFGRVCKKLGIEIITAHSPQAKGRAIRGFMEARSS